MTDLPGSNQLGSKIRLGLQESGRCPRGKRGNRTWPWQTVKWLASWSETTRSVVVQSLHLTNFEIACACWSADHNLIAFLLIH
jgi:hypothetical protein